ncbi:hypothetical protein NXW78_01090 [Bacteroides ovatus]|nr:hypothetical protein [Bacteroides ovatus]
MAKNVLRAWLVDNTVTTDDKTDKIFQLETTRSIDKNIILDRMVAKNPWCAARDDGIRHRTDGRGDSRSVDEW